MGELLPTDTLVLPAKRFISCGFAHRTATLSGSSTSCETSKTKMSPMFWRCTYSSLSSFTSSTSEQQCCIYVRTTFNDCRDEVSLRDSRLRIISVDPTCRPSYDLFKRNIAT